jgi:predicted transcriptional regulator
MNVARFLLPKNNVAYLYNDYTLRQALEKMKYHGYTAIPVITREGKYVNTVAEGDFLWHIIRGENGEDLKQIDIQDVEHQPLADLPLANTYEPVNITASIEELVDKAVTQNFVPVIDDLGSFIGIVTRQAIIKRLYNRNESGPPAKPEA